MAVLTGIPPWLQPHDFIGAARSGASLGLQARGQDIENQQAADRLQLAYDQLASQERRESEAAKQKQNLAAATLALRGQQMDMLNEYRQNSLGLREQRGDALDEYRKERLAAEGKSLDLRKELGEATAQSRSDVLDLRKQMLDLAKTREQNIGERFKAGLGAKGVLSHIKRLSAEKAGLNKAILESVDDAEKAGMQKRLSAIDTEMQQYEDQLMGGDPTSPAGTAAPADPKDPLGILK